MGGIAPVRQSDRLVGFTAEARARRYLAPRPARNAVTPLPHIPWRSHPYVRSSSVGLNAKIVPLLLATPQRRVRYFRYWHNRRLEIGQSMSALPGYFRHQLVPLLPRRMSPPRRSKDSSSG